MPTLAEIEREVASRLGPYRLESATSGTTTTVVIAALLSSIDVGGIEDMFLLRRSAALSTDRQRLVKEYEPSTGTLTVDRVYTNAPTAAEAIELHYLDPANELRAKAVIPGLRRCFLIEEASVSTATPAAERNLTASVAWITSPAQVRGVAYTASASVSLPVPVPWFHPFMRTGAVWLQAAPDPSPSTLLVTVLRPAWSLVNGATSTTGPLLDADTLAIDLDYAAAAAHIEAWKRLRARLQNAAETGFHPSQEEAAEEMTRQSLTHVPPLARTVQLSRPFGGRRVAQVA